jgi:hypothetical protein
VNRDALDHQHLVLGFDLANRFNLVPLTVHCDLTRFQRAGEGAGQSPASRGDDIVKRGRMRRELLR